MNPTPEQMERLKEIARSVMDVHGDDYYSSVHNALLTVWREAQEEKFPESELKQLESACEALRLIEIACTGNDPSDGEGTRPEEILESVQVKIQQLEASLKLAVSEITRLQKEIGAAHVEGWEHGIKTAIYGDSWAMSHARKAATQDALSTIRTNHPNLMEEKL